VCGKGGGGAGGEECAECQRQGCAMAAWVCSSTRAPYLREPPDVPSERQLVETPRISLRQVSYTVRIVFSLVVAESDVAERVGPGQPVCVSPVCRFRGPQGTMGTPYNNKYNKLAPLSKCQLYHWEGTLLTSRIFQYRLWYSLATLYLPLVDLTF
jgi:hypothetical protein